MKFILGFLLGMGIGFAAAMMIAGRNDDEDDLLWAGDDRGTPPPPGTVDGMAGQSGPTQ